MKFLDLFAGIGGFRLGMEQVGHQCIGFCEIDKFARRSYKAIHDTRKEVEMHDITSVSDEFVQSLGPVDILCGGFPCQAFSIAGKRQGFSDTRGTLFFEIARFATLLQPKLLFLENVRGLLNHEGGATFETILRTLDGLGYDVSSVPRNGGVGKSGAAAGGGCESFGGGVGRWRWLCWRLYWRLYWRLWR